MPGIHPTTAAITAIAPVQKPCREGAGTAVVVADEDPAAEWDETTGLEDRRRERRGGVRPG
jgi:hypothetical protein